MKPDQEREPVVAVCGNEARTFGPKESNGVRPLLRIQTFAHHGAAVQFAQEFEEPVEKRLAR